MRARASRRGVTLIEVIIAVGILALVSSLIFGAFDGMARSRKGLSNLDERYRQGRSALARMSRELEAAFMSMHQPIQQQLSVEQTGFIGHDDKPADRIDFTSFSHVRMSRDTHESDQNELSYFGARDPVSYNKLDLARRESKYIDVDFTKGGVVNVLAEDIVSFDAQYLDPLTDTWLDQWDSTSANGQMGRLPAQVRLTLILNGGVNNQTIKMTTKVPIATQAALTFAIPH